jgi:hypothetical protein
MKGTSTRSDFIGFGEPDLSIKTRKDRRVHGSVLRSDRQALATRSEWRSSSLADDQVPRRATGHYDPEAVVIVAGQTTERQISVRQQPVHHLSGHAHQVTRRAVS